MKKVLHIIFRIGLHGFQIIGFLVHIWTCVIIYGWSELGLLSWLAFFFPIISQLGLIIFFWIKFGTPFVAYTIVLFSVLIGFFLFGYLSALTADKK